MIVHSWMWITIATILVAAALAGGIYIWYRRKGRPEPGPFFPRAMDNASKRGSAINYTCPWRLSLPFPDGAITQPDRQHVPWMYSGILAGAPVPVLVGVGISAMTGMSAMTAIMGRGS